MSTITADVYMERIHQIISLIDEENIKIIESMKHHGPRNLVRLAREAGLPYPTVYSRVGRLEEQGLLKTWVHPDYSKIGLSRAMVLVVPVLRQELLAREALKIPGYWLRVMRCMGECNGYYSIHAVPSANRQDFEHYLDQLAVLGLIHSYRIFWLGESYSPIPNFEYYDVKRKVWKFDWPTWLKRLSDHEKPPPRKQSVKSTVSFDKKDLIILKELVKNARTKLVDLAKLLNVTLPAAKYRFDNIVRREMVHDYVIDILPYAPEISDLYEVRLDFKNENEQTAKEKVLRSLPFIITYSYVHGSSSITARCFLPKSEARNFFTLLSALVRKEILNGYSYLLLDPLSIEAQTFAYKDYSDEDGWKYDNREYLSALDKLLSIKERRESEFPVFEATSILTVQ